MEVRYYLKEAEPVTPILVASAIAKNHKDIFELEEVAKHLLLYCEYKIKKECEEGTKE